MGTWGLVISIGRQEAPITWGGTGGVVIEAESPAAFARGAFSLNLWEVGGPCSVTIGNVTFPRCRAGNVGVELQDSADLSIPMDLSDTNDSMPPVCLS